MARVEPQGSCPANVEARSNHPPIGCARGPVRKGAPRRALANWPAEFLASARSFIKLPDKLFFKLCLFVRTGGTLGSGEHPTQPLLPPPPGRVTPPSAQPILPS